MFEFHIAMMFQILLMFEIRNHGDISATIDYNIIFSRYLFGLLNEFLKSEGILPKKKLQH